MEVPIENDQTYNANLVIIRISPAPLISGDQLECKRVHFLPNFLLLTLWTLPLPPARHIGRLTSPHHAHGEVKAHSDNSIKFYLLELNFINFTALGQSFKFCLKFWKGSFCPDAIWHMFGAGGCSLYSSKSVLST